jgi:hypothetical protein
MRLAFLMEKEYPPYAKWYGAAFSKLRCAGSLLPILTNVLRSKSWQERENQLCLAYRALAEKHNDLEITEPLATDVSQFFSRPFKIIGGERFAKAIAEHIADPQIARLARVRPIGSIDIFSDSTDLLEDGAVRPAVKSLYEWAEPGPNTMKNVDNSLG